MTLKLAKRFAFCAFVCLALTQSCSKVGLSWDISFLGPELPTLTALSGYVSADTYVTEGYVDKTSYYDTATISLYINASQLIKKPRLGLYNAKGGLVDYIHADSIKPQTITTERPYEQGYGYRYSVRYKPSVKLTSGIYLVSKKIPVLIRNSTPTNQVLVVYPSNTVNAYNTKGGLGMYTSPRAYITSFLRPAAVQSYANEFVKWNDTPYPFDYISDQEMEDYPNIENYKLMIVIGHSEYWTRPARTNFDRFIAAGKHALILTGNNMWWQVRYSTDKSQLICYKDASRDPITDPLLKTVKWSNSLLKYPIMPSLGADFTLGGYGNQPDSGWNGYKILCPNSPLLAGTNLKKYDTVFCLTREYDGSYLIRYPGKDPILDSTKLKAYRAELIGYDLGAIDKTTVHPFIVYQRTATSGIIVNPASTNWCNTYGFAGPSGAHLKLITKNAINLMMTGQNVFSRR